MSSILDQTLSASVPVVLSVALLVAVLRDVTRARLERFARRQCVVITVDNAMTVVNYLATVRRWRVAGTLVGLFVESACTFTQREPLDAFTGRVGGPGMLIGWFVGALAAEWRIESRQPTGLRRAASLSARRLRDYLPVWFALVTALLWVGATAVGVAACVRLGWTAPALAVLAAALLVAPVAGTVARRIVMRPQPPSAPDVLAADDALRSRSLHVLAGCTLALDGVLLALAVSLFESTSWQPSPVAPFVGLLAGLAVPVIGWFAATSPFAASRALPADVRGVPA